MQQKSEIDGLGVARQRARQGPAALAVVFALFVSPLQNVMADQRQPAADRVTNIDQLPDMPAAAAARFLIGEAIFRATWKPAPDVSDGADGLGPLFSASSCAACHPLDARRDVNGMSESVTRVLRLSMPAARRGADAAAKGTSTGELQAEPNYGSQLQERAIAGHIPEGRLVVAWTSEEARTEDGSTVTLRRPEVQVADLAHGPIDPAAVMSLRRPPQLAGIGLIAAIAETDIAAGADPDDRDGDGIAGRLATRRDASTGAQRMTRFGWKASAATLDEQISSAFHLDMGLSTAIYPAASGDCTQAEIACRNAPNGASAAKDGLEVSVREVELVRAYLEGLPPPVLQAGQQTGTASPASAGRAQFLALGCPSCHRERFVTPELPATPHLSSKPVDVFSDLLLHDMGDDLADPGGDRANLEQRLWRTAPLWGLSARLDDIAAGHIDGLLHDGRARTIEEAILWHGGEGLRAREGYRRLSGDDRSALIEFLNGL